MINKKRGRNSILVWHSFSGLLNISHTPRTTLRNPVTLESAVWGHDVGRKLSTMMNIGGAEQGGKIAAYLLSDRLIVGLIVWGGYIETARWHQGGYVA